MPRLHIREPEAILASNLIRLVGEGPVRLPFSQKRLKQLAAEGRIKTYGNPKVIDVEEFEAAVKAGFPRLDQEDAA